MRRMSEGREFHCFGAKSEKEHHTRTLCSETYVWRTTSVNERSFNANQPLAVASKDFL